MFEDFNNKEKNALLDALEEVFNKLPEPKETDSIEEQFLYYDSMFTISIRHIQKSKLDKTLDAYKMDKLIPLMKNFTAKANEILGE